MSQEGFTFKGANGREIYVYRWDASCNEPVGIVQIFHGMAEHGLRYADFAGYLNSRGITVYAIDQRGHGNTGEINNDLGHLDDDGFDGIIRDQQLLSERIRQENPGVPLFVLGHSFGSFIAQEYIQRDASGLSGVILSGSCLMKGMDLKAGLALAYITRLFGVRKPNRLLDRMSFGSYNRMIPDAPSKFSWLSRDEQQVGKYEADRFCGMVMSTGFFCAFFKGLSRLYHKEGLDRIPKSLPVCILSGSDDPVGKYGSGTSKLCGLYRDLGISYIMFRLYEGARHEVLNETNRKEVYRDISQWIEQHAK